MPACLRLFCCVPMLLVACTRSAPTSPAPEVPLPSNRIAVAAPVRDSLGITFAKVEPRAVAQTLRVPGHFALLPTARAELRVPLAGRITLLVQPLQDLAAGEVVARLDAPQWRQLQRELAELAAQLASDEAQYASLQPLLTAHQQHEQSLQQACAALDEQQRSVEAAHAQVGGQAREVASARAQAAQAHASLAEAHEKEATTTASFAALGARVAAGRQRLQAAFAEAAGLTGLSQEQLRASVVPAGPPRWMELAAIELRAASAGQVTDLPHASGAWLEPGALVLASSDLARLRFVAHALQGDLPRLRAGLPARVVGADAAAAPLAVGELALGAQGDPALRTMELVLSPREQAAWLRPGVVGFLEVDLATSLGQTLAVPLACVLQDGLERVLFRRDPRDPDQVIRVVADVGRDDGRWVEIKSGVREGDEVVLAGAYELILASSGRAPQGGHFHADGTFHADDH